jgi:hypothetical protein
VKGPGDVSTTCGAISLEHWILEGREVTQYRPADTSLLEEVLQLALARFDDAIGELPDPIDHASRAACHEHPG